MVIVVIVVIVVMVVIVVLLILVIVVVVVAAVVHNSEYTYSDSGFDSLICLLQGYRGSSPTNIPMERLRLPTLQENTTISIALRLQPPCHEPFQ